MCASECVCVCMHTYICESLNVYVRVHNVWVCVCMCAYVIVSVCVHMCVCVYIYMCVCVYIYVCVRYNLMVISIQDTGKRCRRCSMPFRGQKSGASARHRCV